MSQEDNNPDKLAHAVDELISGLEPIPGDPETAQLLNIARARRAEGLKAAMLARSRQGQVWNLLLKKLREKEKE